MIRVILALAVLALAGAVSCYKEIPPCHPGTIDYPACIDPTLPKAARDGGAER